FDGSSITKQVFVTTDIDEEESSAPAGEPVGAAYRFGPLSAGMSSASLSMTFPALDAGKNPLHLGIYRQSADKGWVYLPTQVDESQRTLQARVAGLGLF